MGSSRTDTTEFSVFCCIGIFVSVREGCKPCRIVTNRKPLASCLTEAALQDSADRLNRRKPLSQMKWRECFLSRQLGGTTGLVICRSSQFGMSGFFVGNIIELNSTPKQSDEKNKAAANNAMFQARPCSASKGFKYERHSKTFSAMRWIANRFAI